MSLIIDFLPIVFGSKKPDSHSDYIQSVFPGFEDPPIVYINFNGILMKAGGCGSRVVEEPVLNAIWGLRVFKYNGWMVEIFSLVEGVDIIREWVSRYAFGLVSGINKRSLDEVIEKERTGNSSLVDLLLRNDEGLWLGKEVNWIKTMVMLNRMGFLRRGLLPLTEGGEKDDMVSMFKEPIFEGLMSGLRRKRSEGGETRDELIKLIESYAKHPEIVDTECDLLVRARAEGGLLESVLKLLARDRFDPVGCVILAQQDREIQVDQVPPMFEVDID